MLREVMFSRRILPGNAAAGKKIIKQNYLVKIQQKYIILKPTNNQIIFLPRMPGNLRLARLQTLDKGRERVGVPHQHETADIATGKVFLVHRQLNVEHAIFVHFQHRLQMQRWEIVNVYRSTRHATKKRAIVAV